MNSTCTLLIYQVRLTRYALEFVVNFKQFTYNHLLVAQCSVQGKEQRNVYASLTLPLQRFHETHEWIH